MASPLYPAGSTTPRDIHAADRRLHRSFSRKNLQIRVELRRRSYSDNHLCCSTGGVRASILHPKPKTSHYVDLLNIRLKLKSLLFDPGMSKEMDIKENLEESDHDDDDDDDDDDDELGIDKGKQRANWIERLMELRNNWKEKRENNDEGYDGGESQGNNCDEGGCEVDYDEEDAEEGRDVISIDKDTFSSFLRRVSWSDTKIMSRLAFLCNMAYVIPDIKTRDLRRYCGLEFVTSSLEKKAEAAIIGDKVGHDITESREGFEQKIRVRAVYEIAASAASYVQSLAKDLTEPQNIYCNNRIKEDDSQSPHIHKSEMAAYVAASTMTAVVAAGEKQKEEAARDLQSLQSSPCEWFVCDDSSTYTRCFVIQGSDSLASWQANLFFEPTKFEGTDVLVHRGIYEAAKGIYDQFMPEIKQHLNKYGDRAKLQFTGHSLGGSLALLVNLMLLTRKEVKQSALLPVVTFGSPFVFCGGKRILDRLNLDENHIHSVMLHRDIVPRAFSCKYPSYVAQVLKRLSSTFRSHPCLNKNRLLYSPMGKLFILQPNEKSSPSHPLLPQGSGLYTMNMIDNKNAIIIRAFLNSPHPIETLSDPTAYGSEGSIMRDHDSSNYLKAVNEVIRQRTRFVVTKHRNHQMWPLLSSRSPHAWTLARVSYDVEDRRQVVANKLYST